MAVDAEVAISSGDVMRRLRNLEKLVERLQADRRLESASIGTGGLRVHGGGSIRLQSGGDLLVQDEGDIRLQDGGDLLVQDEGDIRVEGGRIVVVDSDGNETFLASTSGLALIGLLTVDTGELLATNDPNDRWVAIRDGNVEFGRISDGTNNALAFIRAVNQDLSINVSKNAFYRGDNQILIDSANGHIFLRALALGKSIVADADLDFSVDAGNQIRLGSGSNEVFVTSATTTEPANVELFAGTLSPLRRSTSSRRHKLDIEDLDIDLDAVLRLRPRTWRDRTQVEENPDTTRRIPGFIAEEVDEAGLTQFVTYDDEGRPESIAYDRMCAALVEVVKDQDRRLQALEARVTALDGRGADYVAGANAPE